MNCPRCQEPLQTITYEGVRIETCPGCGGEWLDEGELKTLVDTIEEEFPDELRASLDAVNQAFFSVDESPANQLKCPKCRDVELNRFNYAASSGITLDKCPNCHGIWLDRNELEQVQILVEEWSRKLQEDTTHFANVLRQIELDAKQQEIEATAISRHGLVNAILRQVVRFLP